MLEVCSTVLSLIVTYLVDCFLFKQLTKSKVKIINIKNLILILVMSLITWFVNENFASFIRLILYNIQTLILLKLIFNKSFSSTTIFAIIIWLLASLSEATLFLLIINIKEIDSNIFINSIEGMLISNSIVTLCYTLLLQIKPVHNFLGKIVNVTSTTDKFEVFLLFLFAMILISSITYQIIVNYTKIEQPVIFYLIFIAFLYFIINFFYQRTKNSELKKDYEYLLDYVKEYEKALDEKGKAQHEYKNQLIVIKGMVNKRNAKLHQYIDDILDISENKEIHILNNLKNIPTGGLKGLIYYKMEHMIEKNMEVHVNVDSTLESKKYWKTCEKNLQNVSTIVGVYLDNAMEAAEKAEKKFVIIDIDSEEDNLVFSFSNTYEGHIDVGKIDKQGYSTKGRSRGYGLSLVQDILNKNESLKQQREINGIFYVQKLIIQNKK